MGRTCTEHAQKHHSNPGVTIYEYMTYLCFYEHTFPHLLHHFAVIITSTLLGTLSTTDWSVGVDEALPTKAWGTIGVPIHPISEHWGRGQDSVQAPQGHSWQTMSLRSLHCAQGYCQWWNKIGCRETVILQHTTASYLIVWFQLCGDSVKSVIDRCPSINFWLNSIYAGSTAHCYTMPPWAWQIVWLWAKIGSFKNT